LGNILNSGEIDFQNIFGEDAVVWFYTTARSNLAQNIINNNIQTVYSRRRGFRGGFEKREYPIAEVNTDIIIDNQPINDVPGIENAVAETNREIENIEIRGRELEKYYYKPVLEWARLNGYGGCQITAGLIPGPRWENPDLLEISVNFGENISSLNIEISSFEVKLKVDPQAVWQAAHYSKFSHHSFIAFAKSEREVREEERVFDLAVQFGLGILVLEENSDTVKFKQIHSPTTKNPSSIEMNNIIENFIDATAFAEVRDFLQQEQRSLARHLIGLLGLRIDPQR
jgi:hypothetical protein